MVCSTQTDINELVLVGSYHLLDSVEALPMETEGLFEQDSVLHRPLIRKRCEVWQVCQRFLNVVFVPEEHPQSLEKRDRLSVRHLQRHAFRESERQSDRETRCQRDRLSDRQ